MHERSGVGLATRSANGMERLDLLTTGRGRALMIGLSRCPEVVEAAAAQLGPPLSAQYLRELAGALHSYYHEHKWIVDDADLRDARLAVVAATQQVLSNGLDLLGISAPESM